MSASHVPILFPVPEPAEAGCCAGLILPLRGDSPREGSSESGRGVVVLRIGFDDDTGDGVPASLEMAVMQDLKSRMA